MRFLPDLLGHSLSLHRQDSSSDGAGPCAGSDATSTWLLLRRSALLLVTASTWLLLRRSALLLVTVLASAIALYAMLSLRSAVAVREFVASLEDGPASVRPTRQRVVDVSDFASPQGCRKLNLATLPRELLSSRTRQRSTTLRSSSASANNLVDNVNILFMTKSKPTNYNRRQLFRAGWLLKARQDSHCRCALRDQSLCADANQVCQYGRLTWTHRFVVGRSALQDSEKRHMISDELTAFFDIVLYPRLDNYRRLTWKVLWILNYVSNQVAFDFVMLLDDDCFVQIWRVSDFLLSAPRSRLYAGHVEENLASVSRSSWNRWQVSLMAYNASHFPPYAWGAGLILSSDVARLTVMEAARWKHPWFGVDDAFMGVLLNSSGIPPTNIEGIYTGGVYRTLGCRGNHLLREAQPLVVAGTEAETLSLIQAQAEGRSLCTVLDSPLLLVQRLVISAPFAVLLPATLILLVLVLGWCWYCTGYRRYSFKA